jgi:hypothetical protein
MTIIGFILGCFVGALSFGILLVFIMHLLVREERRDRRERLVQRHQIRTAYHDVPDGFARWEQELSDRG